MKFNIYKFEEDRLKCLSSFFINVILKRKKQSTHKEQIVDCQKKNLNKNGEYRWIF